MSNDPKRVYSIDAPDQPRLKIARAEIEAVLRKHDLAGVVVLHTPGMSEFFYNIQPSYSCVWIDEAHSILRLKSTLNDYGGDLQAQRRDLAATANMTQALAVDLTRAAQMFEDVARLVNRPFGARHAEPTYAPDPMQAKLQ